MPCPNQTTKKEPTVELVTALTSEQIVLVKAPAVTLELSTTCSHNLPDYVPSSN